jgi:anti-anti-sigma regulatory factor
MTVANADVYVTRPLPNGTLIRLGQEKLDDASVASLREVRLEDQRPGTLYIDFSMVAEVEAGVWAWLIALNTDLTDEGRRLCLLNLTPSLRYQLHAAEDHASAHAVSTR